MKRLSLKWRGIRRNLIIACVLLGSFGAGFVPSVAVAETYDQMVYRVMQTSCKANPEICDHLDPLYVDATQMVNAFWLVPLTARINGHFPKWADPISVRSLTVYSIVRAQQIAIRAEEDCKQGLIRDALGGKFKGQLFPTDVQFAKCNFRTNPDWWAAQYKANVQDVANSFDAGQIWKDNGEPEKEFGGPF